MKRSTSAGARSLPAPERRGWRWSAGCCEWRGGGEHRRGGDPQRPRGRSRRACPKTLAEAIRGPVIYARRSPGSPAASHVYNERFDYVSPAGGRAPAGRDRRQRRGQVVRGERRAVASSLGRPQLRRILDAVERRRARPAQHQRTSASTRSAGTATIGAGAQLIDVYTALAAQGATIPAGSCPSVGTRRPRARRRDGPRGAELRARVRPHRRRADRHRRRSSSTTSTATNDPDLLWALRAAAAATSGSSRS